MRTLVLGTPMVNGEGGRRALSASPSLTVTRRRPGSFREWGPISSEGEASSIWPRAESINNIYRRRSRQTVYEKKKKRVCVLTIGLVLPIFVAGFV